MSSARLTSTRGVAVSAARRAIGAAALCVWLAACGGAPPQEAGELRHLILLTVDTWRADHSFVELAGVRLTPELERLGRSSIRFAEASSVSALTSGGVAGILTGLYPRRSGVVANAHMLPKTLPTLASVLRDAGFATAAFVANPVLAPGYGFEAGFAHYELVKRQRPRRKARGSDVNRRVVEWLDGVPAGERLFLWVHFMEPHGPYEPPEEVRALFDLEAFDAETRIPLLPEGRQDGWQGIPYYQQGPAPVSTDGRDYWLRYAAEVRSLDAALGELLGVLERRQILDRSVLVVAADHGEALAGDHGFYFSHNNGLTQDQVAVPLLLRYPGCEAGAVVDRPVSNVDVFPTVLKLFGLDLPAQLDGFSLLGAERPGPVVSQSAGETSIRQGDWKLRWIKNQRTARLVDLAADPGEEVDLAASHPSRLRELRQRLAEVRRRPVLAESVRRDRLTEEQRQNLKTLGYL